MIAEGMGKKLRFVAFTSICQLVFIILFASLGEYSPEADPTKHHRLISTLNLNAYPMFQDVHVMMFIGFGFLMTFLKKYGFGAVGLNFLISAFTIQWATIFHGLFLLEGHDTVELDILTLLNSDFTAAAVLISFGAVLGKFSPLQLLFMALVEVVLKFANEYILLEHFHISDVGGSIIVHIFGAYFGLAVARTAFNPNTTKAAEEKASSMYHSDLFAMIGSIFLWLFWPSFNSAIAVTPDGQLRAIINTYYSLAACTVLTFIVSSLVHKQGKFNMVHIQNAALAGGVAIGTTADLMLNGWGALLIGSLAGIVSTMGFEYLQPLLERIKLHDTCGVHNLHGVPGILAGIIGIIAAGVAKESDYGNSLYIIYPSRAPVEGILKSNLTNEDYLIEPGSGRSASSQALYQLAAIFVTLGIAILGGVVTGLILRLPFWDEPDENDKFDDNGDWILEDDIPDVVIKGKIVALLDSR
ncbi:DgyrCDS2262 [Dimorphilus gyrociliatus]|uniref:DgyrCDS2262 n=1 Tax=Dimorphilus gyrociliatus TaxID=2664684 RepID=A0A7I8VBK3_9ANNE|nr:DgyrCDS2262 [Dimorphilus gyrociliatus]